MAGATTVEERRNQVLAAGYNGPQDDASINQAYRNAATPGDLASSGLDNTGVPNTVNYANPAQTQNLLSNLQALGTQEYNKAKLNLDSDENAWRKAAQAIANELAIAGVTGTYQGMPTQQAIKQLADIASQQANTMLSYASQFGMWGPPSPGQQTLAAQEQGFTQGQRAAELTGWYTPYAYTPPTTQGNWAAVGTPSQGTALGMQGTSTSWDQLANQLQYATGGYNEDAAKRAFMAAIGANSTNFNGSQQVALSPAAINDVVNVATGGRFSSFAQLSGGQPTAPAQATSMGTGYFVGTDGRIHSGSPQGASQAGWGPGNQPGPGAQAAAGWAPGTESANPNVFLQPPSAAQQQTAPASYQAAGPTMGYAGQAAGQPGATAGAPAQAGGPQYLGAPPGYTGAGAPVQTLAGNEQTYTQWLRAQQQALAQWKAQQDASQNYLTLLSGLRGPADWAQYQKVLGATPGGTQDLVRAAAGQYIPGGGATTGVQPQAANLQTFVGQATGQQPSGQQQLTQMQNTLVAPNQMAPQTWNALSDSQKQMLLGVWESQGYSQKDAENLFSQSLPKYATQGVGAGNFRLQ